MVFAPLLTPVAFSVTADSSTACAVSSVAGGYGDNVARGIISAAVGLVDYSGDVLVDGVSLSLRTRSRRAALLAYVPQNPTLQVNQVLRFEPGSPIHDMAAVNGEFETALGEIACLRFTAAGSFPVHCSIHGFSGTITVN